MRVLVQVSAVGIGLLALTLIDLSQAHVLWVVNGCVCLQVYQLAEQWFWPSPSRALRVCFRGDRYWVIDARGWAHDYALITSVITPLGLSLKLRSSTEGVRRIAIPCDSVDAQSFRRAKVWLRFSQT